MFLLKSEAALYVFPMRLFAPIFECMRMPLWLMQWASHHQAIRNHDIDYNPICCATEYEINEINSLAPGKFERNVI